MLAFRSQVGMGHKTEDAETVVDGHEHDTVGGEFLAVELRLGAPAFTVAAAVDPVSDGEFRIRIAGCGRPDVQVQAVFTALGLLAISPLGEITAGIVDGLVAGMAEAVGDEDAVPRHDGLRFLPPEIADGRSGIRNAPVHGHAGDVRGDALDLAAFDGQDRAGFLSRTGSKQHGRKENDDFFHNTWVLG